MRRFAVGQEWSLKFGAGAPAKIVIGLIEVLRGKTVAHISIVDIPARGTKARFSTIAHAPFEEAALRTSVDRLVAVDVHPSGGFLREYEEWKGNEGGVYNVTVGEVISLAQREL